MRSSLYSWSSVIAALALAPPAMALAHDGTCKSPSEAVATASKALEVSPRDLEARLKLADALMANNCFDDAVHLLEEGEALHERNPQLRSQLREARSMQREQTYFEGLNRAEDAAKLSHNLLRCSRLGDLEACDQALARQPGDPQIQLAKADALLKAKRPADALGAYRRARELAPDDATMEQKIAAAETQRRALAETCQSATGETALQACQSALLPGNDDEFAIRKRTGILLQASSQPAAALDSYIAANLLRHGDRSVALAIVALSAERKDALTLAARGSALLTLGRALDALTPLKQALSLSPDLPEAKTLLPQAERLARTEARQRVADATTDRSVADAAAAKAPSARRYSNAAPVNASN